MSISRIAVTSKRARNTVYRVLREVSTVNNYVKELLERKWWKRKYGYAVASKK